MGLDRGRESARTDADADAGGRAAAERAMSRRTVFVAGFAGAFGAGLRGVIGSDADLRVIDLGGLSNVHGVMAKQRPDALLLNDCAFSDVLELRRLVVAHPGTGVIVGVMDLYRERDQALLAAGARLVVPLTMDESELRAALRLVAHGLVGPPRVTRAPGVDGLALLTERETQVFELLVRRRTAREIADALHIAIPTVNAHTRRIYDKLGVHSRTELEDRAGGSLWADDLHDCQPTPPRFSRDRVPFEEHSDQARSGARPSAVDMRAAMGLARWPRRAD